jgi:hypothetical protein
MARQGIPRRRVTIDWPKEHYDRVSQQAERRGVTLVAFVMRSCETMLQACEGDGRPVAMQLGLPVLNVVVEKPPTTTRGPRLNIARASGQQ